MTGNASMDWGQVAPLHLQSCLVPCLVLLGWEGPGNTGLRTLALSAPKMYSIGSRYQSLELGVTWNTNGFLLEAGDLHSVITLESEV